MRIRRRLLQAYVVGAAVAGTALVFPYWGRALVRGVLGDVIAEDVPFFLLPIAWGGWNWLRAWLDPPVGPGGWGALLGVVVAAVVNTLLWVRGDWTVVNALLLVFLPMVYAVGWAFVVEPLNRALGGQA